MTQLVAYLFVVIPVSFGGKYTSVGLHEGQTWPCVQNMFWCMKECLVILE